MGPVYIWDWGQYLNYLNTLRPRQNVGHFTFKCIFLNEDVRISIEIAQGLSFSQLGFAKFYNYTMIISPEIKVHITIPDDYQSEESMLKIWAICIYIYMHLILSTYSHHINGGLIYVNS